MNIYLFTAAASALVFLSLRLSRRASLKALCLTAALLFLLILQVFFYRLSHIPSLSMYPTLKKHDVVWIHLNSKPAINEAAAFIAPNGEQMGKRVIAGPGSTVVAYKNRVFVDGFEALGPVATSESDDFFFPIDGADKLCDFSSKGFVTCLLGPGYFFMIGDNRSDSLDSRFYGPVHESQILGRITHAGNLFFN